MHGPVRTILILGGTRDAVDLASRLAARPGSRVISSLAGRTRQPKAVAGESRVGGFGGADGLAAYLAAEKVDLLIDATHPFAERISANAVRASENAGVALLRLVRPAWKPEPGDDWMPVVSLDAAVAAIPSGARAFLALGSQHLAAFAGRGDIHFVIRMVDPPQAPLPLARYDLVIGKPSGDPSEEAALFLRHAVTRIVCRNSGGAGAYAKLVAARELELPVVMIERPAIASAGGTFATIDDLLAAIG